MVKTLLKLSNVVKTLNLKVGESLLNQNVDRIEDPVLGALKRYKNHPKIIGIEGNVEKNLFFSFATSLILNNN